MFGQQGLVPRNDDFAATDRFHDEFARFFHASHQFHHHLDRRIVEQVAPVFGEERGRDGNGAVLGRIFDRDFPDNKIPAHPFTEERPVFFQIKKNPGSNRTEPG